MGANLNICIRWATRAAAVFSITLTLFMMLTTAVVAGGPAITGNFYRQNFVLAPGETSAGIEAYVIVLNTDTAPLHLKMRTETPPGVTIALPETDFVLEPGGQKRLDVVVKVGESASPGEYQITVAAEPFREGDGIKVVAGVMQQATLKVVKSGMSPLVLVGSITGGLVILAGAVLLLLRRRHLRSSITKNKNA